MMKSAKAEGLVARTAIYARKSNDDSDKAAGDTSCERQVAHAREYALRKGWTVDEAHVYVDDDVSGAEYLNRPGFTRLLAHLKEFNYLVMSESSRLGRDMMRNTSIVVDINESGVRIFHYLTDEEERTDSPEQKLIVMLKGYGSETERLKAVARARDATLKLAREGRCFGGKCFGYDNIWRLKDGTEQPGREHEFKPQGAQTIYRVNAEQAATVRAIYRMYAEGHGAKIISYTLNGLRPALLKRYFGGVRPPRPYPLRAQRTAPDLPAGWSARTVGDMLRNPRYLGFIPFGARQRKYVGGTQRTVRTPDAEQLFPAPELRIIPEPLAAAVKKRTARMAKVYLRSPDGKRLAGRPETGRASQYLLSGLVECADCGAPMIVTGNGTTHGAPNRYYICSVRSNRGAEACGNALRPKMRDLDAAVLETINHQITPAILRAAARRVAEMIRAREAAKPDQSKTLRAALSKAEAELARWVEAIGRPAGGKIAPLVEAAARAESEVARCRAALAELASPVALDQLADKRLEQVLAERAAYWRTALAGDILLARQALRKLIVGRIVFAPVEGGGYRLSGATPLGALWTPTRVKHVSPRRDSRPG